MGSKRVTALPKHLEAAPDGSAIASVGRYIQGIALQAFNDLGGQETFNKWAKENYGEFATKMLTKMMPRAEVVQPKQKTVEDLLDELDSSMVDVTPAEDEDHA